MQTVDLLLTRALVITMDPGRRIIEDGAVAVRGSHIADLGTTEELLQKYRADRTLGLSGRIVMPGFVNLHNHGFNLYTRFMTIPMEGVDPSDFGDVLTRWYWPKVEDTNNHELTYLGNLLCCSEMLLHGVTTTADMLEGANVIPGGLKQVKKAFLEAGMRGVLSYEASERVSREHGQLGNSENVEFVREHNGKDGLVTGRMAVHTAFSASPAYLRQVRRYADELGCGIQLHIAQSPYEVEFIRKHHGVPGSVHLLEREGFLGPDVVAAHCIYVSDEEIDILARRDVKISFNVKSNQRAGNGVSPVHKFLSRGMTVGLGLDGINIMDMHEMMTHAAFLTRIHNVDRTLLPAKQALEMATIDGAAALGMKDEIGSLEPGKKADIIVIDTRGKPSMHPMFNIWEAAAFAARGKDVEMVVVDGRIVVEQGKLLTVDVPGMLDEVYRTAEEWLNVINATPVAASWRLTTID